MTRKGFRVPVLLAALILFIGLPPWVIAQTSDTTPTDTSTTEEVITEQQTTTEQTTTYYEDDEDRVDREDAIACGICAGVGLGIPILGILISAFIAWWIYRDATRRGIQQAALWAILGFFFNLLGLIIYLIARPQGPPSVTPPPAPPPMS